MIIPNGWIKEFLSRQMGGLTGNIEACGYPFNELWWGTDNENGAGENSEGIESGWWTYEQTAYWLDGFIRCSILLKDEMSIERGKNIIMSVIDKASSDGYLGPQFLKETEGWNRWPHVVFFRACIALYEYSKDEKIIDAMKKHYLDSPCDYSYFRDVFNVEILLWLYEQTQERTFLTLAETAYIEYNQNCLDDVCDRVANSEQQPYAHGVTYCEYSKLGALLYCYTKKDSYLIASKAAMDKLEKLFLLPGGCICSNEFLISNHYMQSYETCLLSDYTWALYALAKATDDGHYYDLIERCIFNAGLGSVTEDFKALQYFSCANQTIADRNSNHNLFFRGSTWMSYRPNPGTECCPGNVNRFMPNYVMHMWEKKGEIVACNLYGDSVYQDEGILIKESTQYPFEEKFLFTIQTKKDFRLRLRVPCWVKNCQIKLNGEQIEVKIENEFTILPIKGNCSIELMFFTEIEKVFTYDGVYFRKGVLVYSLGGAERREIDKTEEYINEKFPAYNMYPNFEWRYAVDKECGMQFVQGENSCYFERKNLPKIVISKGYLIDWDYEHFDKFERCINLYDRVNDEVKASVTFTPHLPDEIRILQTVENLVLYPYGCCKLRLTVFPLSND